jgi:hypothetical protein
VAINRNYEGEVDGGNLPHGYGVMTYIIAGKFSVKYEGQWRHGKKEGEGAETSQHAGVTFVGIWRSGLPERGIFHFRDGTRQQGYWKDGRVPILD